MFMINTSQTQRPVEPIHLDAMANHYDAPFATVLIISVLIVRKNNNKGKGKKKAHSAEAQYEYSPAGGMQISGEHHQNSWLVVPKKTASVFTSYDARREMDDEDDLPIELIEETSWTKEQWQALGNGANSSSSSAPIHLK